MRLLSHNLLICNVAKCEKNNFPLIIEVEKSIYRGSDFNRENIKKLVRKLDWFALHKTVTEMGETSFPKDLTAEYLENEDNLRKLHRIILDVLFDIIKTHIVEGKLICPNCKREYPIVNGIPNMILNEN
jgi:multifunctional methyltransferase subunit TRM112